MKAKTIRLHLREKVDEWIASVEDRDLREDLRRDAIVTGGAIASMLLRERVNDYDVYLRDRATLVRLARYYVGRFRPTTSRGVPCEVSVDEDAPDRVRIVVRSSGVASEGGADRPYEYFEARQDGDPAAGAYVSEILGTGDAEDANEATEAEAREVDDGPKYRPVFLSTNAITLSHRVQVITRFYGEPDEIHANYDFAHCTNYWSSRDGELVLRPEALEALLARELRYVGSKYPLCSLIRVRKFVARQWAINAGQILKMVLQLNEMNLRDINVLRDQLTGVDAAYFHEVLAKVRDSDPDKLNAAYLCQIVDRIF